MSFQSASSAPTVARRSLAAFLNPESSEPALLQESDTSLAPRRPFRTGLADPAILATACLPSPRDRAAADLDVGSSRQAFAAAGNLAQLLNVQHSQSTSVSCSSSSIAAPGASPRTPTKDLQMQEEPIDRHRDHWMERKRRIDHEEAKRRDEMESRYHEGPGRRMNSPPMVGRPDVRLGPLNPGDSSRNGYSPRTQLPSINNLTNGAEEQHSCDDADAAYKRRRLAEGMHAADDRRRGESFTPPEHAPAHHARPDMRPPQHRYGEEREMRLEDRSPQDGHFGPRPNGRLSPLDDRGRPMRSPGVAGAPLPPSQDFRKPSVLSGGPEEVVDGSPSMPGLARRRGDAAQAKASRLHIDTGSGPTGGFDMSSMGSRSAGVAKSAPPQKLTFEREGMEPPQAYEAGRRDAPRHLHPQAAGNYPPMTAAHPPRDFRAVSGSRLHEISEAAGRRDPRDDGLVGRDGQRLPEHPQTANPLARQAPALNRGLGGVGGGYVPQTATLPSPAYHTTQFARGGPSVHRAPGPQPPHTARLPEHLRSPPSSKAHFLGLFSDFYESLHDSRTLKATLEDQIRRSNTLLHTLQSSRRVLEETVERRVREERVMWEGRVRGLEARVRELESKNGEGGAEGSASSGRGSPSASSRPKADASRSSSATREAANDKMPSPPLHKPGFARTASKASLSAHRPAADRRGDVDDDDHDMDDHGERDELSAEP